VNHLYYNLDVAEVVLEATGEKWPRKSIPWKMMLAVLAKKGVIFVNYPEGIYLPGRQYPSVRCRGLSEFSRSEQVVFLKAFEDKNHPLHFVKKIELRESKKPFYICTFSNYIHSQS
jgi:hypothetical protein